MPKSSNNLDTIQIQRKWINPIKNLDLTRRQIGYVPRKQATLETYKHLGFKSGLEIHQQLKTDHKLFCHCPAGIYQKKDQYDAEIIRHMRPTLSELGEYDGTALMEFKTRKNIVYHIKNETACTYDIDDTPPFLVNRKALRTAMEIALLLETSIVGELHITRKQYLDGSIPTGFQRTGIVGIEGKIPLSRKTIRIIQLSMEEDSCREVSDSGHVRIYTTDRLGMPLVETVTYPDMQTPDEVAEAAHHIRFLTRSTGKVNTGIGAAREDVNVSVSGGTRVEIKGVAHIKWIPELTHNEAFRQSALLAIRDALKARIPPSKWSMQSKPFSPRHLKVRHPVLREAEDRGAEFLAVNLPYFQGILSFFTQPGQCFADELSDRLMVIACIPKPNMVHSEMTAADPLSASDLKILQKALKSGPQDAQILLWGPSADIKTAKETIEERCKLAFSGVPNETRKGLPDGTTIFERVLPGPDRMYPDTDSAPIPIEESLIQEIREHLPSGVAFRIKTMTEWGIPPDCHPYILRRNFFPLIEEIRKHTGFEAGFIGTFFGHHVRTLEGRYGFPFPIEPTRLIDLFRYVSKKSLKNNILRGLANVWFENPDRTFDQILKHLPFRKTSKKEILSRIPSLRRRFRKRKQSKNPEAETRWIMGQLRPEALGNLDLAKLRKAVEGGRP
jgi:glutamyl-tRNA(Gln) amidotransferase subunit E